MSTDVNVDLAMFVLDRAEGMRQLEDVCRRRMQKEFREDAKRVLLEGEQPDHEAIAYKRGFFAGLKFLIDAPKVELAKLDRTTAKGDVMLSYDREGRRTLRPTR